MILLNALNTRKSENILPRISIIPSFSSVIGTAIYMFSFFTFDDDDSGQNNDILGTVFCFGE